MNEESRQLAGYFLDGNHTMALEFLSEKNNLPSRQVFQQFITPAMQHIGSLWEENRITVADEHLATGVCDFVLSRLYNWQGSNSRDGKKVMLFCLEGEQHYIGLKMASTQFVEHGWQVRFFGPDLPLEYAVQTVNEWEPDAIAVSVSIVYHLPKLERFRDEFASLPNKPKMIVGGRLVSLYDLSPYCSEGTVFVKDLTSLNNWLEKSKLQEAYHG